MMTMGWIFTPPPAAGYNNITSTIQHFWIMIYESLSKGYRKVVSKLCRHRTTTS